jgi:hypothetical protein
MSDVLQTAMKYRSRLKAELGKVEEFLRMAEEFTKGPGMDAELQLSNAKPAGADGEQSPIDRLRPPGRPAATG